MIASVWTDWLTAVGTVGAVCVAVLTPASRKLVGWIRRPRIKIEMDHREPFVEWKGIADDLSGVYGGVARIRVSNVGRSEAVDVRAQVFAIWDRPDEETIWFERELAPINLDWCDSADSMTRIMSSRYDYVEFCNWATSPPTFFVRGRTRFIEEKMVPPKTYRLGIAIFGPNVVTREIVLEFKVGTQGPHSFEISEEPMDVRAGGLAGMSHELSEEMKRRRDEGPQ